MQVQSLVVGNGSPLQYSCLENFTDRGTWQATVHGVTKSQTRLSTRACVRAHTHTHTRSSQGHQLTVCPVSTGINTPMDNMLAFIHMDTCACL